MSVPKTKCVSIQNPASLRPEEGAVEDDLEMSKAEILNSIERGLRQMIAGEGRPALEFLDELDNE